MIGVLHWLNLLNQTFKATFTGGLLFITRITAPHTGQSSQLVFEANYGNAQFLSKLAGAVVWHRGHKSFKES
jgi:hypothetical protein